MCTYPVWPGKSVWMTFSQSRGRWTHPLPSFHLGCILHLIWCSWITSWTVYLLVFGSHQEWRMWQSNQICMEQQHSASCLTPVILHHFQVNPWKGNLRWESNQKNAPSATKLIIKLIYGFFLAALIFLHLSKYLPDFVALKTQRNLK